MHPEITDGQQSGRGWWQRLKRALAGTEARGDAGALYERGTAAEREGRNREAAGFYGAAAAAQPKDAEYQYAWAAALRRIGRNEEALVAYRAGIAIKPEDARMRVDLGLALLALGRLDEAQAEIEQARNLAPDLAEAHHNLGIVYHQLGRLEPALEEMALAHRLAPGHAVIHSNLLFILNYSARHTPAEVFAEHRRFGELHGQPAAPPAPEPDWPRPLRIGYVSPDFRSHVVSSFMFPILARHDRERFDVYCYYTYPEVDRVTEALRGLADAWRDCAGLSDAELAERIRRDRIDILVDLAGHTVHHRLKAFALRPAPVQATYLGYPNTTGMSAIDYRISDAKADPPGVAEPLNTERLARLPHSFLCYRPGPDILEPGELPALAAGHVTFGSFNNFQKLSEPFFDAVVRILKAVPRSRLLVKAKPLGTPAVAQRLRDRLVAAGIESSRIELMGWDPSPEGHLATYRRVDVALDSFPYNGTTTTCEALWMGVPVVGLRGDSHAGRVGASLLATVGLPELVAGDAVEYGKIAARLAGDLPRLATLRAGMRARLRASPLMDEQGFVRNLEGCYLGMWHDKLAEAAHAAPPLDDAALRERWTSAMDAGEGARMVDEIGRELARGAPRATPHYLLGCTFEDLGRAEEAAKEYEKALTLDPGHAKAANNLGCLHEAMRRLDDAEACYAKALAADPKLAPALFNRGGLARQRGRTSDAEADLRQAIELEPGRAEWHATLADTCLLRWRLDEAVASARAALALDDRLQHGHFALGNALMMLGRAEEAEASLRRAVELDPDLPEAHSNLLLCLHYRKGDQGAALAAEHFAWAKRHATGLALPTGFAAIDRSPGRRLNVGYLSPNLHRHSVATFFEPLLSAHDRRQFRVVCYSGVERPDEVTARLKAMSDDWRELGGLGGDAAARLIREDRIDILVDLAGQTGGGRPLVFARRPAPVQISWLGYPNTTGIAQMDYRMTDAEADPPGDSDRWHSEVLQRLPQGFLCFSPDADSPAPGDLPAAANGAVTFGCFNNLAKVTPEIIAHWARLLLAVPRSRMLLKAHALGSESARRGVLEVFARHGIGADRVVLHGPADSAAGHLARYRDVDIALDTYPYHGTTTTCEALWMGVPVVTLAGPAHVSRVGVSILSRVSLQDLVTRNAEDYVACAAALAADLPRLQALRCGLRERMRASPLMDASGFARSVETVYRSAWTTWLAAAGSRA